MNTPDGAPKNGDFVAYLAELEARQLRTYRPHVMGADPHQPAAISGPTAGAPAAARIGVDAAKAVPVGLAIVGFAFLIAGLAAHGGLFLVLIGVFLIWQAVRTGLRSATADRRAKGEAAGGIAALLATRAQRNKPTASK